MQTIKQMKTSLVSLALLVSGATSSLAPEAPAPSPTADSASTPPPAVQPGPQASTQDGLNQEQLHRRYGVRASGQPAAPAESSDAATRDAMARRYGLKLPTSDAGGSPQRGVRLLAKLDQIILPSVSFDGLPLPEVLKYLDDQSRKLDPDKEGVNFLINRNFPLTAVATRIDPTTGLPAQAAPEPIDMSSVMVSIPMPLRNISMKNALGAIAKVASPPVEYSIEDYAVIFSPKPEAQAEQPLPRREAPPQQMLVRTFKVDTNTFVAGLESAFGIKLELPSGGSPAERSRKLQGALKDLLRQLGISLDSNKSVFYNELTGVIMMRGTPDDLEVVRAAVETLGGAEYGSGSYGPATTFGGGAGAPAQTRHDGSKP